MRNEDDDRRLRDIEAALLRQDPSFASAFAIRADALSPPAGRGRARSTTVLAVATLLVAVFLVTGFPTPALVAAGVAIVAGSARCVAAVRARRRESGSTHRPDLDAS